MTTITRLSRARWLAIVLIGAVLLAVVACGKSSNSTSEKPSASPAPSQGSIYPNAQALAETSWLTAHLADPDLRVIDTRLAQDYQAGHIKGAVNIPIETIFDSSKTQGRADPQKLGDALGSSGIASASRIVVYDAGKEIRAATLFRILEDVGQQDVAVLNGGLTKWKSERQPTVTEKPSYPPAQFTAKPQPDRPADKQIMLASLSDPGVARVDARTAQEYGGGHIPGAVDVDWTTLFTAGDAPMLKSADELQKIFQDKGVTKNKVVYTYCQTGQRASVDYFALRLLGYAEVRVYEGSWQEWGSDYSLPVEK